MLRDGPCPGYDPPMADDITGLFQALDPLRPLAADEVELYVDWQRRLDPERPDIGTRLTRAFQTQATPERTIVRLVTGHRGSGKTTELNRVASELATGTSGRRVFVSTLFAQRWLDLDDVRSEDIVLQMVRQLVVDLNKAQVSFATTRFSSFFKDLWTRFKKIRPEAVDLGMDPLKFSFSQTDFPTARRDFRDLLRGQLRTLNDLVNKELLPTAREQLAAKGFADIVLIVDDLDKIRHEVLEDAGTSNHEALFLHGADSFRALKCSLLMTIPIELVYSTAQAGLRDRYGAPVFSLPVMALTDRNDNQVEDAEKAMAEVLGRRLRDLRGNPGADPQDEAKSLFADPDQLREVVRLSGGHVRSFLGLLTELLNEIDELPLPAARVAAYVPRAARDLAVGLQQLDREMLRTLHDDKVQVDDPRFFRLLRDQYAFRYEFGASEEWYDVNPLLLEGQL